jgi:hypothetical protein
MPTGQTTLNQCGLPQPPSVQGQSVNEDNDRRHRCTPAIAIHHLDNLDAKINLYLNKIASDPDETSDWTAYQASLGTKIFKKDVMGIRK